MIKKGIKLELYRAFHNRAYILALLIECVIAVLHFIMEVFPERNNIVSTMNIDYPLSVFNSCMIFDTGSFFCYAYYYSVILIGTLPFATSYFKDIRGGYIKNVYTRMDKRGYLIGKYLAVFLSAGSVCVLPILLNMFLTAMVIPALPPQRGTGTFPLVSGTMLNELFYTCPFAYFIVYLMIDFVMVGLFACIALSVSRMIYNQYVVLFVPFLIFLVLQTVLQFSRLVQMAPYFVMNPMQNTWENPVAVISDIVILFAVTFGVFYLTGGKKRDEI